MCDSSTLEVQIDYSTSAFVVQVLGPERRLCGLHLSSNVILLSQSDCHCMSDIVESWPCEEDCDFFFTDRLKLEAKPGTTVVFS